MNNSIVSLQDYAGLESFGQGFGLSSADMVSDLNKALDTGAYGQFGGVSTQTGGAALQVESLENSLKVLTYSDKHVVLWKKIFKKPAYSTVEEYNQLVKYGSEGGGFVPEGIMPEYEDSTYRRQASFVKFLGTTRSVTHPMTLVRSAHGDVIALENQNGILWMMKKLEHALFWGDSKLGFNGAEGVEFDGLDKLIDATNIIDLSGADLEDKHINWGAQMILGNYGTPTDLFLPYETLSTFSQTYFPKERVIMPTANQGYQAGLVVNQFQTHGGPVEFSPDLFLQKTKPLPGAAVGDPSKIPTAPASVSAALASSATDAQWGKSGAGTYSFQVTACNRYGESAACTVDTQAVGSGDLLKAVELTITNAASVVVAPEFFRIYRSEKDGSNMYQVAQVAATSQANNGTMVYSDKCVTMANTYSAFMGELSPEVIQFKQLAPIMKMDLAILGPAFRWMILLYGVPQLFAPKKWMKFRNIKATTGFGTMA